MKTYSGVDNVELEIVGNPTQFTRAELAGRYGGGDLRIDFYRTDLSGKGYGSELVSTAIEAIGPSKVRTVSGAFGFTNKSVFNDLKNSGLSPLDAAWGTPIGKTMKTLGFTKLEVDGALNLDIRDEPFRRKTD